MAMGYIYPEGWLAPIVACVILGFYQVLNRNPKPVSRRRKLIGYLIISGFFLLCAGVTLSTFL